MNWERLIRGEVILSLNIAAGLAFGVFVLRCGVAERLLKLFKPLLKKLGIAPALGLALGISLGSSRAGAALLSASLDEGRITERTAKLGTLMLSFPAYLHRWPTTMIMSVSMAGLSGAIFAVILLFRSVARFVALAFVLRREADGELELCWREEKRTVLGNIDLVKKMRKTLPLAWVCYAAAFTLVPYAENFLRVNLGGHSFLPLAGWTVAAASISHVSASLALAGGSLAAGELTVPQAVFSLLLGNSLGVVARVVRQNAGYYFGLFPKELARQMLFLNIFSQAPFILITLIAAAFPLVCV